MFIPDPDILPIPDTDLDILPIPDPGFKKATDPGIPGHHLALFKEIVEMTKFPSLRVISSFF